MQSLILLADFLAVPKAMATEVVQSNITWTIGGVIAAALGVLKMFGIGAAELKVYAGKVLVWIGLKVPGDTIAEKITLATLEQILDKLIDKLLEEGVDPEVARRTVSDLAPLVQKARLARFDAAVAEKCSQREAETPHPKGALPKLTEAL